MDHICADIGTRQPFSRLGIRYCPSRLGTVSFRIPYILIPIFRGNRRTMGILHQFEIANNGQSSAQFGMSNPSDNAYISQLQGRPSVSVAPTSSQAHRTASGSHLNQINYSTAQGNSKRTPLPTRKAPVAVMVSKMSSSQPIQKVKKQPSSISCEPCKRAYIKVRATALSN